MKKTERNCRTTIRKILTAGLAMLCIIFTMTACGKGGRDTTVVLTTGFGKDEIFRIEDKSCTMPEIMVYLTNTQNQYEDIFGVQIWDTNLNGVTLEQNVKETVLAKIAQIKTMNLLAKEKAVTLSEEEQTLVTEAAAVYFGSLNETEVQSMGVTQKTIEQLYAEYALAEKVYDNIIKDINPEISDDEARTITVEHILIKTYSLDGNGKKVLYSESAKATAYQAACEVLALARDGQNEFGDLITKYSEDSVASYSFRKGEVAPAFETAAFNLGNNEISEIVETEFGYHIIKCLNTFNREETDSNKLKIVEQRKKSVFGQVYDDFVGTLTRNLNKELWEKVSFLHEEQVKTSNFFDVYTEYFG